MNSHSAIYKRIRELRQRPGLILLLLLGVIGFLLYASGLSAQRFGDDLKFIYDQPASGLFQYFWHQNPFGFYRPLEASFLALVQVVFGVQTWPVHVTHIAVTIALSWLVFQFVVAVGGSRLQAALGSLYMLVSQANVSAVLGNDTSSQVFGTWFRVLTLFSLYRFFWFRGASAQSNSANRGITKYYSQSVLFFALALLSKETNASLLFQVIAVVAIAKSLDSGVKNAAKPSLLQIIPFLAVFLLYLTLRQVIVTGNEIGIGASHNEFRFGINIVRNAFLYLLGAAVPVSSVSLYSAVKTADWMPVAIGLSATAIFSGAVVAGCYLCRVRRVAGAAAILGALTFVPTVALNHVSELHVYDAMPFVSVIVGLGLGGIKNTIWHRKKSRAVYCFAMAALFLSHIIAVETKSSKLVSNGQLAQRLLDDIVPCARKLPENGELILVNPVGEGIEYSVYLFRGFNVLRLGAQHRIQQLTGRTDITTKIVDLPPPLETTSEDATLVLTLVNGEVRVQESQ